MSSQSQINSAAFAANAHIELKSMMLSDASLADIPDRELALHLMLQKPESGKTKPVLYVHGATFPASNAIFFRFDGVSWADALNQNGFAVWSFDFAGYGGSERYEGMCGVRPMPTAPLGQAPEAARQIERVVRKIIAETGVPRIPLIAHSWGTIAAGLFAERYPELVERLVFFGPIAQRAQLNSVPALGPWRFLTVEEQRARFVEDVPAGHPPVLMERDFPAWAECYLDSDPDSRLHTPHAVKTPNGPLADIMSAWSGHLAYDPVSITAPLAIIRGEWDRLSTDADADWLRTRAARAPETVDIKIAKGTHLMHLEKNRHQLYEAASEFLKRTY
jgi:pimeloyl-ACP methyl ester carboxylesterase